MNMNTSIESPVQPHDVKPSEGAYFHTREVAVDYPLYQSLIAGGSLGVLTLIAGLYFGWPRPWSLGILAASLVQCVIWFLSLLRWHGWVKKLEALIGMDLNRDTYIGERPEPLRIELVQEGGHHVTFIELPATQEQLTELANGLLKGIPFAEGYWTGANRPFSKNEFLCLRDEMLNRGLIAWINIHAHAQGMQLTAAGRAVMRRLQPMGSRMPPSPTPEAQSGAN